ncbi:cytochrome C peroxidase [Flavobacteria bacterium BAL38]|uniref:cytochrome-c peroxidase n=1 Tax=unclassified Flavobacterium TaxID=196869 RepID=UPI0000F389C2|nr:MULTISPECIES: cytochrome c peroxidase [unclassified Flavobacterium]EAZ94735.1 cytochrome C peroxidase [Flavobacteria bacterium BAL38]MQP53235.1 c-type cytochrome [Flavobacterium sp. LMO9]MQP62934.1 c-type cytochrome [Flavobacterium sp. LMO6]
MKKIITTLTLGLMLFVFFSFSKWNTTPIYLDITKNWPKPVYDFSKNPLTEEGFQLGRNLFYDPILSRDNTISCASCHLQQTGFTHVDHDLSHGIDGKIGTRNSLTLQNLAWNKTFMWDGGVNHLDVQYIHPITSEVEMDETMENVVKKLQEIPKYKELYKKAFGTDKVTGQLTLKALSQFVVMLTTSNSKYDKVVRKEEKFTEMEQKGYNIFKQNCASCHKEPLFTSDTFENNGLSVDPTLNDYGRMKITQIKSDSLKFKIPTLRNIEFTFPYMHDGRFKTLNEVIKHYNSGIKHSNTLSKQLQKPMNLSDNERTELVAFLKTLSDKEFLYNPKYSYPKNY